MGVKLQYNPSTGKLSYNALTGKIQVFDNICSFCEDDSEETPSTITVTFSDITINDGCLYCPFFDADFSWIGVPDINRSFELTNKGNCFWTHEEPASGIRRIFESSNGTCQGNFTQVTWDNLFISVKRFSATQANVKAELRDFSTVRSGLTSGGIYTVASKCVVGSGSLISGPNDNCQGGAGGTFTVTE